MVSKPVAPPWNDSSKNLVKDLAQSGPRYRYHVMTPRDYRLDGAGVTSEGIYRDRGAHTPPLQQNLRVLARLLRRNECAITHFFFAPNPRTSLAARASLRVRRRRTVQTVCSVPATFERADSLLFADRVIALSRHTRDAFLRAGIASERLVVIPPGIVTPTPASLDQRAAVRRRYGLPPDEPLVIYPGDYQFSGAADMVARAVLALGRRRATTIFACRIKQEASRREEARIRNMLGAAGALSRVRLLNQVDDIIGLLGACDICVLPADSLFAKMDLPLVLIEAMGLGVPIVVVRRAPLDELLDDDVGLAVPAFDAGALADAIGALLDDEGRRRRLGEAGIAAVKTRYDIHAVARRVEALYDELLDRPIGRTGKPE